jgi:hypothetical protein
MARALQKNVPAGLTFERRLWSMDDGSRHYQFLWRGGCIQREVQRCPQLSFSRGVGSIFVPCSAPMNYYLDNGLFVLLKVGTYYLSHCRTLSGSLVQNLVTRSELPRLTGKWAHLVVFQDALQGSFDGAHFALELQQPGMIENEHALVSYLAPPSCLRGALTTVRVKKGRERTDQKKTAWQFPKDPQWRDCLWSCFKFTALPSRNRKSRSPIKRAHEFQRSAVLGIAAARKLQATDVTDRRPSTVC